MHLIEEGEAPVRRDAAAGEGEHAEAGAKQDDLAVLVVEEDDPLHALEAVREQVACHLQVGQPGDEGARVDERVEGRHVRGHRVEESDHGPIVFDEGVAHHRGCRQDREHLGVVALLVDAPAEVRRKQIGGRAAEAEAAPKEGGGSEVLPIGGELQGLVLHREGEGEVLEVVLHRVREPAEELIQDVHLLGIERIEELQRPQVEHRARRTAALDARCAGRHVAREQGRGGVGRLGHGQPGHSNARWLVVRATGLAPFTTGEVEALAEAYSNRGVVEHVAHPSHRPAGEAHPLRVEAAGRPVTVRSALDAHLLEEEVDEPHEVGSAQSLVPVREDGQPDQGVRVRELGGERGHILAHEGDGEQPARLRYAAAAAAGRGRGCRRREILEAASPRAIARFLGRRSATEGRGRRTRSGRSA